MKTQQSGLALLFLLLCLHVSAQNRNINAAALRNGAFLISSTSAYTPTRNTTAKIDEWTSEAILDENGTIGWCSKQGAPQNQVFVIELSEEYIIDKFNFNNSCQRDYAGICAQDVTVELSTTNSQTGFALVDIYQLKEYKSSNEFIITPKKARWIRLSIKNNYGNREYTELMEFEAWGKFADYEAPKLDITGVWNSNWGWVSMNKNQHGYIYGCYEYNKGTLDAGEINRRVFEFKWDERFQRGWATLVINKEGNRITGIWGHNNDRSQFGFWDFTIKTATPFSCDNDKVMTDKKPDKYTYPESPKEIAKPVETATPIVKNSATYLFKFHITDAAASENISAKITLNKGEKNAKSIISSSGYGNAVVLTDKNISYTINIEKDNYLTYAGTLDITEEEKKADTIFRNYSLTKIEIGKAIVLNNVLFQQGTTNLLQISYPELEKLVKMMVDNPKMVIELSGHTDNQGDARLNLKLSEDRVGIVEKYLITKGISKNRVSGIGYGGTKPIADNKKEQTRKLNRRVEFTVVRN